MMKMGERMSVRAARWMFQVISFYILLLIIPQVHLFISIVIITFFIIIIIDIFIYSFSIILLILLLLLLLMRRDRYTDQWNNINFTQAWEYKTENPFMCTACKFIFSLTFLMSAIRSLIQFQYLKLGGQRFVSSDIEATPQVGTKYLHC